MTAAIKFKGDKQTDKCIYLVKTEFDKDFLWGHNLKLKKGNQWRISQYI